MSSSPDGTQAGRPIDTTTSRIESSITELENRSKELEDRLVVVMGPSQRVEDPNEPPISGHSAFADRLSAIASGLAEILERLEV